MNLIEEQIQLEQQITQTSVDKYRREILKAKQDNTYGCTQPATKLLAKVLDNYTAAIRKYLDDYAQGKAVRSTMTADLILRLKDVDSVAYITAKVILNHIWDTTMSTTSMYKAIGQAIEDEFKMREFRGENQSYYKSIQEDLNRKGAKANRKKWITSIMFNRRLEFHLDKWTVTEKFQTGLVLTRLFMESTGLIEYEIFYKKKKKYKTVIPTQQLVDWFENIDEKMEAMSPLFLPMVCPPKDWVGVFEGGYISPYIKRNKLVKNNSKEYLKQLETAEMPLVYEAINHLQATKWQVNGKILEVVKALWDEGKAIAELPDREDTPTIPFPYPELTKEDVRTPEQAEVIKKWKRDVYEIHKSNIQKRSVRLLVSQVLRIANQFKDYEAIYYPYQMDFRGRLYPIPVLLQPQGSDLAKGLLHFAEGKGLTDDKAIRWFKIHGANVYGYDKESYDRRVDWVEHNEEWILQCAAKPLEDRRWAEADKPFQFLAWCFEYAAFVNNPSEFRSHIPIQLDGTCNGLQHYSALLRDIRGGRAVNLINAEKPNDIYATVAEKLEEKLNEILRTNSRCNYNDTDKLFALHWLNLGINRKLTKRPVMVLPYGGTLLSCREYIQEYLADNYSPNYIWKHFEVGDNPTECSFKVSTWLSKHLWASIQETLQAAIVGMGYLKAVARIVNKEKRYIEWITPVGLTVRQEYCSRRRKEIKTELYGSILKTTINLDTTDLDNQRQINGICPNFIHSLDAACLMVYLIKAKDEGINSFMTVHDCYGVHAADTEVSARLLREAFVEIYRLPILEYFTQDVGVSEEEAPPLPEKGDLDIEEVLKSDYFFN